MSNPSSPTPTSRKNALHPSGSIKSIMNFSSSPPTSKDQSTGSVQQKYGAAASKGESKEQSSNVAKIPEIKVNLDPEEEEDTSNVIARDKAPPVQEETKNVDNTRPRLEMGKSLNRILAETFNLDVKEWDHSEDLLKSLIDLKTEQERTKGEIQRCANLQRSLEVIDYAVRSEVPGYLIPYIFQGFARNDDQEMTIKELENRKEKHEKKNFNKDAKPAGALPTTSVFKVNMVQSQQPVNYQFHHWQNPDDPATTIDTNYRESSSTTDVPSGKKRKSSFNDESEGKRLQNKLSTGHRRNQSDITQLRSSPELVLKQASHLQHPSKNYKFSALPAVSSHTNLGSPSSSRQQHESIDAKRPPRPGTLNYPQQPHHFLPGQEYQHGPLPPAPLPLDYRYQLPQPPHIFQQNRYHHHQPSQSLQIHYNYPQIPINSPGRYYESTAPPITATSAGVQAAYQFPYRGPAPSQTTNLQPPPPPSSTNSYQFPQSLQQQGPGSKPQRHTRQRSQSRDQQDERGKGQGQGAGDVSFLISTPSNPPK